MKLLDVKNFRQSPDHCGPACLKMIFAYFGVKAEEKEIAKIAGTKPGLGTQLAGLKRAAAHYGFVLKYKENASLADITRALDRGVPPFVNWFNVNDTHYSVVVGLDDEKIYLRDPEIGKLRTISRLIFYRLWFDYVGDFIKSRSALHLRTIFVVEPKG